MKVEINENEIREILAKGLNKKYGEMFEIQGLAFSTKRPKKGPMEVVASFDLTQGQSAGEQMLKAVADR